MPAHALRSSALVDVDTIDAPVTAVVTDDQSALRRRTLVTRLLALLAVVVAVASLGACTAPSSSGRGLQIERLAYSHLGAPYGWGAAGPSTFDCSGLVQYTYRQAGLSIPRTSYSMAGAGRGIAPWAAQPGDVVVLGGGSHVGIYVGGGQMIDAPHSGAVVTKRAIYASYSVRRMY